MDRKDVPLEAFADNSIIDRLVAGLRVFPNNVTNI